MKQLFPGATHLAKLIDVFDDAEGLGWAGGAVALFDGCSNSGTTNEWVTPPGTEPNGPLYGVHHGRASCTQGSK